MSEDRVNLITKRLNTAFSPRFIEVIDDSEAHRGHAGAQNGAGHYTVLIKSDALEGLSRVQAHRLIYAELDDLMPNEIHALAIKLMD